MYFHRKCLTESMYCKKNQKIKASSLVPNLLHIFCPGPLSQLTIIHLSLYFHISKTYFHISEKYFHISEITIVHSPFYFHIHNDMTCEFKKWRMLNFHLYLKWQKLCKSSQLLGKWKEVHWVREYNGLRLKSSCCQCSAEDGQLPLIFSF